MRSSSIGKSEERGATMGGAPTRNNHFKLDYVLFDSSESLFLLESSFSIHNEAAKLKPVVNRPRKRVMSLMVPHGFCVEE